jgi:glycolate oxidase
MPGAAATLLVESDLPGPAGWGELDRAERACAVAAPDGLLVRARYAVETDLLREGRRRAHDALETLGATRRDDVVVPRSRVPDLLHSISEIAERMGLDVGVFGRAGDGNLHPTFVFDGADPAALARVLEAEDEVLRATLALGLRHGRAWDRHVQAGMAGAHPRPRHRPCHALDQGGP